MDKHVRQEERGPTARAKKGGRDRFSEQIVVALRNKLDKNRRTDSFHIPVQHHSGALCITAWENVCWNT